MDAPYAALQGNPGRRVVEADAAMDMRDNGSPGGARRLSFVEDDSVDEDGLRGNAAGYSTYDEEGGAASDSGLFVARGEGASQGARRTLGAGRRRKKRARTLRGKGVVGARGVRRRRRRIYAECVARELDVREVVRALRRAHAQFGTWDTLTYEGGIVHLHILYAPGGGGGSLLGEGSATPRASVMPRGGEDASALVEKHVFLFPFGCVVLWNFSAGEERSVLGIVARAAKDPLPGSQRESDDITYEYAPQKKNGPSFGGRAAEASRERDGGPEPTRPTALDSDNAVLGTVELGEKMAVSLAFAQSVKLTLHEETVDEKIEATKEYPRKLAATGKIEMNQIQIAKKIGELFIVRNSVNLYSDILDTPEVFWDEDRFEPTYHRVREYLDIDKRIEVMNQRMEIIRELLDLLASQQEQTHGMRLEFIIIVLILVEVIIEVVWNILLKDILGIFPLKGGNDGDGGSGFFP
jgi:uncharacterized Rmd1/YagE family protein